MKEVTNTIAKLLIGLLFGAGLTLLILIKPITDCCDEKIERMKQNQHETLTKMDSINDLRVKKILRK